MQNDSDEVDTMLSFIVHNPQLNVDDRRTERTETVMSVFTSYNN